MVIALLIISFMAVLQYFSFKHLNLLISSVVFCVFFDLLFTYIRRRQLFVPYAALVTGLIIGLITDPAANYYQTAFISAIAMASKNYLRLNDNHIFNPAAFGLYIGGIVLNTYVSWWGVTFQNITQFNLQNLIILLTILSPLYVSFYRMRRYYSILTFLMVFTLVYFIFGSNLSLNTFVSIVFNPNTIFFTLVMLPEPMTSPINPKRQILYGLTVALLVSFFTLPSISIFLSKIRLLPDIFIPALLAANLIFFKYK